MSYPSIGSAQLDDAFPPLARRIAESAIALTLIAGPLLFGGTEAWAHAILLGLIALAAGALLVGAWARPGVRAVWSWTYVPLLVLLAVGAVQLIDLPANVREALTPGPPHWRAEVDAIAGVNASDRAAPASLYPLATQRELRLWVAGAVLFICALHLFNRSPRGRVRILRVLTAIGLAMALLALGQYAFDARTILGLAGRVHPNSGTFANHSHFGQFINLTIGSAVALVIVRVRGWRSAGLTWDGIRDAVLRDPRAWDVWLAGGLILLGPITIALALTRGGVIGLAAGAFVAASMLVLTPSSRRLRRRRDEGQRDLPLFALLAGTVVLVIAVASFSAVYDRLASLRDLDQASGGRLEIVRDILRIWRTSPWIGTGLGTHAFVFPAFDHSSIASWASHAENEYAQLLEETGAIGLLAGLTIIGIVIAAIAAGTHRLRRCAAANASIGTRPELILPGLALALTAVLVQSAFDFGQHLPGIAFCSVVICALALTSNRDGRPHRSPPQARPLAGQLLLGLSCVGLIAAILGFAPQIESDRRAAAAFWEATQRRQQLDLTGWNIDRPAYRELLTLAMAARDAQPRDIEYAFWLNAWRWEAIEQQSPPDRLQPPLSDWARQLVDELLATTNECPTFGRPLAFAGQIQARLPDASDTAAVRMIVHGASLAPYDPMACFRAGQVSARAGDPAEARRFLLRALALGWPRQEIVLAFARDLQDDATAHDLARTDLTSLDVLEAHLATRSPLPTAAIERISTERLSLTESIAASPTVDGRTLDDLAIRFEKAGQPDRAIDCLKRATLLDYGNADRRMRLASLLAAAGRPGEAIDHAEIAARDRPGDEAIQRQLRQWRALEKSTTAPANR